MKKRKLNSGGFVLVETLIVAVFVMSIFSILYNNFYPLIGEYEKREVYDEVDAKYAAYWIKRMIQDPDVKFTADNISALNETDENAPGYFKFSCNYLTASDEKRKACEKIVAASQVRKTGNEPHIYITNYQLTDFKNKIEETDNMSGGMHRYVENLPEYKVASMNGAKYRVIVEFYRQKYDDKYLAYATFEVKK